MEPPLDIDPTKQTIICYWGAGAFNELEVEIFEPIEWPNGPRQRSLSLGDHALPRRVIEIQGFHEGRIPKEYLRELVSGGIYHFGRQDGFRGLSVKACGYADHSALLSIDCPRWDNDMTPHDAIDRTLDAILQEKFPGRSTDVTAYFKTIPPLDLPARRVQREMDFPIDYKQPPKDNPLTRKSLLALALGL